MPPKWTPGLPPVDPRYPRYIIHIHGQDKRLCITIPQYQGHEIRAYVENLNDPDHPTWIEVTADNPSLGLAMRVITDATSIRLRPNS